MSPFDLADKRIIVTGGAGHIGKALCKGLSDAGADVVSISSKHVEGVHSIVCDVADEEALGHALGNTPIDGLVQCAARVHRHADLATSKAAFLAGLETTVAQYFGVTRAAVPRMAPGGSIVNVASMWGSVAPNPDVYLGMPIDPSFAGSAAAAGILQMTRHMAVALAAKGIRVNALVPGWFPRKSGPENPAYMQQITSRVPMGRIGQPQELVGPALFLLSSASSYMTGQHLIIDGGYSIQ